MLEILTEQQLDHYLCEPTAGLLEDLAGMDGDFMVIGAGGKIGPTVSVMLRRACAQCGKKAEVYAVSRFQDPYAEALLRKENVSMLRADLSDPEQVMRLPRAKNVIFLLGRKFGTHGSAYETWQTNVVLPSMLTRQLGAVRYVMFSSGNVYPFTPVESGGCTEETEPAPVGEYAMTCLGRERVFEYAAKHYGAEVLTLRLNYAVDLRYGVLYDLAKKILDGEPVSLAAPAFNCVSQRYVCSVAIRALKLASSEVEYLNVTGPETVYTKDAALLLARALNKDVRFTDEPGTMALLSNAGKCMKFFGPPDMTVEDIILQQAQWLCNGGRVLSKPTHFEEREGKF